MSARILTLASVDGTVRSFYWTRSLAHVIERCQGISENSRSNTDETLNNDYSRNLLTLTTVISNVNNYVGLSI